MAGLLFASACSAVLPVDSTSDTGIVDPSDGGAAPDDGSVDAGCTSGRTDTGECEICFDYDIDVGSAEKARARPQRRRGVQAAPHCEPHTRPGTVLWRAPHDGTWLVDVYGSEASLLRGWFDPTCEASQDFDCQPPSWTPYRLELTAGTFVIIAVDADDTGGQNRGPGNLLVNIVPLVAEEAGQDCLDSSDNDLDGLADCDDPTCAASAECTTTLCANESLPSALPIKVEGEMTVEDHVNRFQICGRSKTRQRVFAWQAPVSARVVVDANRSEFAAQMSLRRGTCFAHDEGGCASADFYDAGKYVAMGIDVTAGEWIYIILGGIADSLAFGADGSNEHYVLQIRTADIEDGEKCMDGIDNDGNGAADYSDPNCADEFGRP